MNRIAALHVLGSVFLPIMMLGCVRIDPAKAESLAEARLAVYLEREDLDRASLGVAKISFEADGRFVFDYTSDTKPKHLVRVYVSRGGRVEMHRLVE